MSRRRTLLRVDDLKVQYPWPRRRARRGTGGGVRAVDGVTLDILPGETLGLVGPSGCGKTTTGRAILQLIRPSSGRVNFDGVELTSASRHTLRRLRKRMQMVFQNPGASLDPRMTVADVIAEPIRTHGPDSHPDLLLKRAQALMEQCELDPDTAHRHPPAFSAGQQQRIAIARALASDPDLVVCDEPVSALDVSVQARILNLLVRLARDRDLSYLFISHDLATVRHVSDRIAVMFGGRLMEIGPAEVICRWPLHPCTRALVEAVPDLPRDLGPTESLTLPPSPRALGDEVTPVGCRFRLACSRALPGLCDVSEPRMRRLAMAQYVACHLAQPPGGTRG